MTQNEGLDFPDVSERDLAVAATVVAGTYAVGKLVHKVTERIGIPEPIGRTLSVGVATGAILIANETEKFIYSFAEAMEAHAEEMEARLGQ